jgi:flagellar basal body-associated protein FliL
MTESKPSWGLKNLPLRTKAWIWVLGACALLVLATTLFIFVQILRIQADRVGEVVNPEPEAPPPVHVEEHPASPFAESYELKGMSISLGNRNQTLAAYAEFNLLFDCPTKEAKHWMELNRASIRDSVYESALAFTLEDFSGPEGFTRLKKAILDGLKERFGGRTPREVVINDWIIR